MAVSSPSRRFATILDRERANNKSRSTVLLLGMVFAHTATEPKRGQEFRDHVRCLALEEQGYQVFTLDDKHEDQDIPEHCRANFADHRRMISAMQNKWGGIKFDHIVLDYFFCPVGWARDRWNIKFFTQTLPSLANDGFLVEGGKVWLPNLPTILAEVEGVYQNDLNKFFEFTDVESADRNPLHRATNAVERELLSCPDALTNETQMRPLYECSNKPFLLLEVRKKWRENLLVVTPPPTPTRAKKSLKRKREETETSLLRKRKAEVALQLQQDLDAGMRRSPRKVRAVIRFTTQH